MNLLYTRLIQEWQDLHITYPQWLTHIVMDELYYAIAIVAACVTCFVMGLMIGFTVVLI
jgi:hypothetical protein